MFGTVLIYLATFISLRIRARSGQLTSPTTHSATPLMILYPLIYVICTSPLAVGRIAALAGQDISLGYFCAAGTMIACNGWLDVLLYASTRADIVFSEGRPGEETGLETFAFMGKGHRLGTVTTIEGGTGVERNAGSRLARTRREEGWESRENLYGLNQIGVKGEVVVSSEAVRGVGGKRVGSGSASVNGSSWDQRSGKSSQGG